jgi:hypothetical protein
MEPFLSFLVTPQTHKAHKMLALMFNPHFKGLGLIIQYVGKEKALQVASDYNTQVLSPLLVCAYKVLNPTNVSERNVGGSTSQSSQCFALYDVLDTNEDMALLVVKEQLTHFKINKVTEEECKYLFAWWKAHEVNFFYVEFVAQQILGIVGSQIKVEQVFKIANICTNLQQFSWAWIILKCL